MDNHTETIEKLIEKAAVYGHTSFELLQCHVIYKSSDMLAKLAVKLVLGVVLVLFLFVISIGASLWIGDYCIKPYYGFFAVALFYIVLGIAIYVQRYKWIKKPVRDFIIKGSLK
jgi:hypothetical protein